jgi:hypothetical protein
MMHIKYVGVIRLPILIMTLQLIGVYLGEDPRTNFMEMYVSKRLDYIFMFLWTTLIIPFNEGGLVVVQLCKVMNLKW